MENRDCRGHPEIPIMPLRNVLLAGFASVTSLRLTSHSFTPQVIKPFKSTGHNGKSILPQ